MSRHLVIISVPEPGLCSDAEGVAGQLSAFGSSLVKVRCDRCAKWEHTDASRDPYGLCLAVDAPSPAVIDMRPNEAHIREGNGWLATKAGFGCALFEEAAETERRTR